MRCSTTILCMLLAIATIAGATTYTVYFDGSGDYPTIQEAIDACADGDIVELGVGLFSGPGNRDLNFGGKAITVRSVMNDPGSTTLSCDTYRGISFISGEDSTSVLEGVTIWVSHYGIWPEYSRKKPPDVAVFGHSHRSGIERVNGTLRVNPGSACFPMYKHTLGTVGFLTIEDGKVDVRLQQLEGEITGGGTQGIPGFTS